MIWGCTPFNGCGEMAYIEDNMNTDNIDMMRDNFCNSALKLGVPNS